MSESGDTKQIGGMGVNSDPLFALPRYRNALRDLVAGYDKAGALTILTGADGSGRRRLLRSFAATLKPHVATAFVSASEPRETILFSSVFGQFGYDFSSQVLNELTGMLRVFAMHQAELGYRPLIGILDAEKCSPALADVVRELARDESARKPALHLVLAGTRSLRERLACDDMVESHLNAVTDIDLPEFNEGELCCYLDARYDLADVTPDRIAAITAATGNRVERVDAYRQKTGAPPAVEPPATSRYRKRTRTTRYQHCCYRRPERCWRPFPCSASGFLIGRAEHNDIVLDSRYISRHHALIVAGPSDAHWLVDLNSRNGTFVIRALSITLRCATTISLFSATTASSTVTRKPPAHGLTAAISLAAPRRFFRPCLAPTPAQRRPGKTESKQ